ncbi:ATP binding cassette (ABC) transporter subfamily C member [Diabrotica virgifera virgifera]|nr:ATP binding cassette (ABC) transporter subfamily C member [Diabrotica virgifera virgifera]
MGIQVRTALCSLLFRKVLKLSPAAMTKASLGNIVTLITKDVQQIRRSMFAFNDIWVFTVVISVTCYLLYARLGVLTFFAVGMHFCIIPIEFFLGKMVTKMRNETSEMTDERIQVSQEVLSATKIIKMYTWEDYFYQKINLARTREVAKMVIVFYLRMILMLLGAISTKIGFYLMIMGYIWMEQPPDASIIFFITAHYDNIVIFFGYLLPEAVGRFAELSVTIKRVNRVLIAEELDQDHQSKQNNVKPYVELKNITVCVGKEEVLSKISFKVDSGLTLVTGKVGSSKSTLLKAILQEYPLSSGEVVCSGTVSYASQHPWCFPSTIKQNILFGEKYNEKRYQEVLKVCALEYDLNLFEKGDETILTDNGQNLSKGQQARVNLSRAIYRQADIYLLDDCLSALDAHVHKFIFKKCIKEFLKEKICILVTQSKSTLTQADAVYVLDKGHIIGSYNPQENTEKEVNNFADTIYKTKEFLIKENGLMESMEVDRFLETEQSNYKNIYEEEMKKGAVDKSVYIKYISYGGGAALFTFALLLIGSKQAAESYSEKLISVWSDDKQKVLNIKANISNIIGQNITQLSTNLTQAEVQAASTFQMYTVMVILSLVLELLKTFAFLDFCKRASINIHKAMIKNVLHSVMAFFDTHFIGNILNRFSQDVINVDENLPFQLLNCLEVAINVGAAATLLMTVNPYFFFYISVTFGVMLLFLKLYLPITRNLRRLEASTRSPMIGHLNAALEGVTTVRAYKAENMIIDEYERHQDVFTSAHYSLLCFKFGMGFYMSMLAGVMVTLVICSFVLFETDATAGSIGLALTQVIYLGALIQGAVRCWADLETLMTATERALEYTGLKSETTQGSVPKHWPKDGTISFQNVSLSYNSTQRILNNLSFQVQAKEKIGIVGRTGAGKSSIISTIFRLYEVDGKITIDGVDIKLLPLKHLRKHLAIIPQDPILFSGTIRSNLDPFGEFQEKDLWEALEKANLKTSITNLDIKVSSYASNFSLGQKQMVCLARAILIKSKIVILDEATSTMDHETENLIQETIKHNFSDSTVLTIAHRLQSILECDKVLVLDRGQIKEFGTPKELLENKIGHFSKMVAQGDMSS